MDIISETRGYHVGDLVDIDMYKRAEIIEDYGETVLLKAQTGQTKEVYKSLLDKFGELCNSNGLTKKGMAPYMQQLTEWERINLYLLQREGYNICRDGNDYVLVDEQDKEIHKVAKRIVHKLKNSQYLRIVEGSFVLNPSRFQ